MPDLATSHRTRFLVSFSHRLLLTISIFFFFNDTATTEIYTLSLHDALPISPPSVSHDEPSRFKGMNFTVSNTLVRSAGSRKTDQSSSCRDSLNCGWSIASSARSSDRKSTRLNSSHLGISYAVFCLKKKKNTYKRQALRQRVSYNIFVKTKALVASKLDMQFQKDDNLFEEYSASLPQKSTNHALSH